MALIEAPPTVASPSVPRHVRRIANDLNGGPDPGGDPRGVFEEPRPNVGFAGGGHPVFGARLSGKRHVRESMAGIRHLDHHSTDLDRFGRGEDSVTVGYPLQNFTRVTRGPGHAATTASANWRFQWSERWVDSMVLRNYRETPRICLTGYVPSSRLTFAMASTVVRPGSSTMNCSGGVVGA